MNRKLPPSNGRAGFRKRTVVFLIAATAILAQALPGGQAQADEYDIVPSVIVKSEYTDNLFFSSKSKTNSFISAVSPRLELARKTERTSASLVAGFDWFVYWDTHDVVQAFNQQYRGQLSHRLSERLQVSMDAGYWVNNQPDENLEKDGVVIDALRRNRQNYSAGMNYALTEKSTVGLSYLYQQEDYPGLPSADNNVHGASFGYEYDLRAFLPAARGRFNAGFNRYELDTIRTENYTSTIGLGWALGETWDITADMGGRFSNSRFDEFVFIPAGQQGAGTLINVPKTQESIGWVANAALTIRGEVQNGSLSFSRNVGLSSSRRGTSENTSVSAAYRRFLTDTFSTSFSVGYQMSRSDGDGTTVSKIDDDYFRCNAGVRYDINRNMALDVAYSYLKALYNETNTSADRNSLMVNFTFRHPLLDRW